MQQQHFVPNVVEWNVPGNAGAVKDAFRHVAAALARTRQTVSQFASQDILNTLDQLIRDSGTVGKTVAAARASFPIYAHALQLLLNGIDVERPDLSMRAVPDVVLAAHFIAEYSEQHPENGATIMNTSRWTKLAPTGADTPSSSGDTGTTLASLLATNIQTASSSRSGTPRVTIRQGLLPEVIAGAVGAAGDSRAESGLRRLNEERAAETPSYTARAPMKTVSMSQFGRGTPARETVAHAPALVLQRSTPQRDATPPQRQHTPLRKPTPVESPPPKNPPVDSPPPRGAVKLNIRDGLQPRIESLINKYYHNFNESEKYHIGGYYASLTALYRGARGHDSMSVADVHDLIAKKNFGGIVAGELAHKFGAMEDQGVENGLIFLTNLVGAVPENTALTPHLRTLLNHLNDGFPQPIMDDIQKVVQRLMDEEGVDDVLGEKSPFRDEKDKADAEFEVLLPPGKAAKEAVKTEQRANVVHEIDMMGAPESPLRDASMFNVSIASPTAVNPTKKDIFNDAFFISLSPEYQHAVRAVSMEKKADGTDTGMDLVMMEHLVKDRRHEEKDLRSNAGFLKEQILTRMSQLKTVAYRGRDAVVEELKSLVHGGKQVAAKLAQYNRADSESYERTLEEYTKVFAEPQRELASYLPKMATNALMSVFAGSDPAAEAHEMERKTAQTSDEIYFTDQLNDGENAREKLYSYSRKAYELKAGGAMRFADRVPTPNPAMWKREIARNSTAILNMRPGDIRARFKAEKYRADSQAKLHLSVPLA